MSASTCGLPACTESADPRSPGAVALILCTEHMYDVMDTDPPSSNGASADGSTDSTEQTGRRVQLDSANSMRSRSPWLERDRIPVRGITAGRRRRPGLEFFDLADLRERVKTAGRARYLIQELWPEDAYGVIGAQDKAGKTWATGDLAVSITTDTRWLGRFDCLAGPVLLLHGEGGERNLLRRLDAIAGSRDIDLDRVIGPGALRVALRVPRLGDAEHLASVERELDRHSPIATLLDPLYLATPAGAGRDLAAMGEMLGAIQEICQDAGSALIVVAQWNKGGEGTGPSRFTGVGPGAWGRVLGSAAVEQDHTDPDGRSTVSLLWEFIGGEIPEKRFRVRREVWAENPGDLGSPMHYRVEVTEEGAEAIPSDLTTSQDRVLAALGGGRQTVKSVGDALAVDGRGQPLKKRTIQEALAALADKGLADGADEGEGTAREWWTT